MTDPPTNLFPLKIRETISCSFHHFLIKKNIHHQEETMIKMANQCWAVLRRVREVSWFSGRFSPSRIPPVITRSQTWAENQAS
jgi:hypothetical protein